ncbi:hypothetical protein KCU81_g323, partial [Aureobasidium melanogenum]
MCIALPFLAACAALQRTSIIAVSGATVAANINRLVEVTIDALNGGVLLGNLFACGNVFEPHPGDLGLLVGRISGADGLYQSELHPQVEDDTSAELHGTGDEQAKRVSLSLITKVVDHVCKDTTVKVLLNQLGRNLRGEKGCIESCRCHRLQCHLHQIPCRWTPLSPQTGKSIWRVGITLEEIIAPGTLKIVRRSVLDEQRTVVNWRHELRRKPTMIIVLSNYSYFGTLEITYVPWPGVEAKLSVSMRFLVSGIHYVPYTSTIVQPANVDPASCDDFFSQHSSQRSDDESAEASAPGNRSSTWPLNILCFLITETTMSPVPFTMQLRSATARQSGKLVHHHEHIIANGRRALKVYFNDAPGRPKSLAFFHQPRRGLKLKLKLGKVTPKTTTEATEAQELVEPKKLGSHEQRPRSGGLRLRLGKPLKTPLCQRLSGEQTRSIKDRVRRHSGQTNILNDAYVSAKADLLLAAAEEQQMDGDQPPANFEKEIIKLHREMNYWDRMTTLRNVHHEGTSTLALVAAESQHVV